MIAMWKPHPLVIATAISILFWCGVLGLVRADEAIFFSVPLHPPAQFNVVPRNQVLIVPKDDAPECKAAHTNAIACSRLDGDLCVIYMPTRQNEKLRWDILRHELAHCNGWIH